MKDSAVETAQLTESIAKWKRTVEAELKGVPFDKKLVTRTFEGVAIQPLYTRIDLDGLATEKSWPGEAPFLRGTRPQGYKQSSWLVAQELAIASASEFNAALTSDLMHGQDCVVLDAEKTSVDTSKKLSSALAGVDLTAVPVHLRAGVDATALAAGFLELARGRGVATGRLAGAVTADPLAVWARSGGLPASLDSLYDSLATWTRSSAKESANLKTVGVDAALWGDAGATAVQELAFALSAAVEYMKALAARDISAEVAGVRLQFRFSVGPQFFPEVAKFRAFRPLWTRVLSAFGVDPALASGASVTAATGTWNKTRLDQHVNMLRVTTEALSAVLGGVDALHIAPFDELSGRTDDVSRRIARNVHTLIAEEFSFTQTADAAGGSWYVEKLTDEFARKAWELFQDIEGRGGFVAALRIGHLQQLVTKAAAEKADAIAKRRLGLVGTNLFPNLRERALVRSSVAPAGAMNFALGSTITPVTPFRVAQPFEELREASDAYAAQTGARPKVFLAKMGPPLQHKARADFSAGFFATGGFEALGKQSFETAETAAAAAIASNASVVVLCSTDDTYPELVPVFAKAVKTANPAVTVVLAGMPADAAVVTAFRAAGIDEFIHIRANVPQVLANLLKKIGALS
ncbi:MAG: methylmalonyl-CoA mutase family protein [Opitutaceae bacterium]